VSVVKSLWASIQGDPMFIRALNGWLTIFGMFSELSDLAIRDPLVGSPTG
jgi:hypothetical protein